MSKNKGNSGLNSGRGKEGTDAFKKTVSVEEFDKIAEEADKSRTRKPGSQKQSGSSGRHNNGRGGGK